MRVLDVVGGEAYDAWLVGSAGGVALKRTAPRLLAPETYQSPGWIDLHTQVYHGVTSSSLHPDAIGLSQCVHLVADAGSAGEATLPGLVDYLIPSARTQVRVWLSTSSVGVVTMREAYDLSVLDAEQTVAAARAYLGTARHPGRSSGLIVGALSRQPLELANLAARTAGLPLLVHIGEAPPLIDGVLDLLEAGDVVSHCYHGKLGGPWQSDGCPTAALARALRWGRATRRWPWPPASALTWPNGRSLPAIHRTPSVPTSTCARSADPSTIWRRRCPS